MPGILGMKMMKNLNRNYILTEKNPDSEVFRQNQ